MQGGTTETSTPTKRRIQGGEPTQAQSSRALSLISSVSRSKQASIPLVDISDAVSSPNFHTWHESGSILIRGPPTKNSNRTPPIQGLSWYAQRNKWYLQHHSSIQPVCHPEQLVQYGVFSQYKVSRLHNITNTPAVAS